MRTIKREIASAVIISKDNMVLLGFQNSSSKGVYPECWHIPGGGIEEGETPIEAMQREVREEVGIDISKYNVILVDDSVYKTSTKQLKDTGEMVEVNMHFNDYRVDINDKNSNEIEVYLTDSEFSKYVWCRVEDLKNINLTPPSIDLFKKIGLIK